MKSTYFTRSRSRGKENKVDCVIKTRGVKFCSNLQQGISRLIDIYWVSLSKKKKKFELHPSVLITELWSIEAVMEEKKAVSGLEQGISR